MTGSSHTKINTGIAESLVEKGYNVSIVLDKNDEYAKRLRRNGVYVYIEPRLPRELSRNLSMVRSKARANKTFYNTWEVAGTNVNRMFGY